MANQPLRNIAIIAHVDHGKTTLVDKILHQCQLFRENEEAGELILDNNDQERERGITILAKNVSVQYKGTKINIIDTPGHADFGGEVERVLNMADGVLLLVDAFEGAMPQTRYVLSKALALGKTVIVVVNKVDKDNCRPDEVQEEVFELMFNLDATEEQLEFKTVYGSAKMGWMGPDWKNPTDDVTHLLDVVLEEVPAPEVVEGTVQLQITNIDYSKYIGRMAMGRITRGHLKVNQPISLVRRDGSIDKTRVKTLYVFDGLGKKETNQVECGDLCTVAGMDQFDIGDTIADAENPEGLEPMSIDEPTMSMLFTINDSPFFGKEGKYVTSRHIRERLFKETEKNLALKIEETESPDAYMVYGRGVMHLSVLIETMRREGYELQVGKPRVIIKEIDGKKHEPVELLSIDVPETYSGKVIELVSQRKGDMTIMEPKGDLMHLEFNIPSRGIIGLRTNILNGTAGEAVMTHRFLQYEPWKGEIEGRSKGAFIAMENGTSIPYSMDKLQDRGKFFIPTGVDIYEGQVIGEHSRDNDLVINVTKTKKLTNMRSSGADDKVKLPPPVVFSLEQAMEYIGEDEYVEVTPLNIRMRKILLKEHDRKRSAKKD
ncbi:MULTISPECIES: translational GTPase TypA [unclassified Aureispira]|uniref:translational GTPase TypA n=1 Tax=unclassified Aureispira TaxID=2649989 RepID=UPI0006960E88|nr:MULTISPECIES: translational GTPase TypA [unclassified Aureispira]WMX16457.1 translational GTPase TypA [Aureispira sp. CCB-E]